MTDTNNPTTNKNSLICLQINLQHCRNASLNLSQVLVELNVDIALIQEPYAITNKFNNEIFIPNIPVDYTVHHNLNVDHAYGAIIRLSHPAADNFVFSRSSNWAVFGVNKDSSKFL